jgi:uncharacterized Tic20 family protein
MAERQMARASDSDPTCQRIGPTDEWTLAALAHASVLLTIVLAFVGGVGVVVGPLVALAIYMGYRNQSHRVAFQALQAVVYQVAGILAYVVLVAVLVVWVALAWVVAALLSVVGIGLLLLPFALLLTVLTTLVLLGAPLAWVAYGLYAAFEAYQGRHFGYLLVADLAAGMMGRWGR